MAAAEIAHTLNTMNTVAEPLSTPKEHRDRQGVDDASAMSAAQTRLACQ